MSALKDVRIDSIESASIGGLQYLHGFDSISDSCIVDELKFCCIVDELKFCRIVDELKFCWPLAAVMTNHSRLCACVLLQKIMTYLFDFPHGPKVR